MSDVVQIVTAALAALAVIVPSYFTYLNGRQITILKKQTDGLTNALNTAIEGKAGAVGELKGRADSRLEAKEDAK